MSTKRTNARHARIPIGLAITTCALGLMPSALAQPSGYGPQVAAAQTEDDTTQASGPLELPSLNVGATGETATGPVDGYVAQRSATATKTDTPLNEMPQSITVITRRRSAATRTRRPCRRCCATPPACAPRCTALDNRGDWFTLRGGSEGSMLLDGLRAAADRLVGRRAQRALCLRAHRSAARPGSVIAGQNGPGGVVNLVSKRPQAEAVPRGRRPVRQLQPQAGRCRLRPAR